MFAIQPFYFTEWYLPVVFLNGRDSGSLFSSNKEIKVFSPPVIPFLHLEIGKMPHMRFYLCTTNKCKAMHIP